VEGHVVADLPSVSVLVPTYRYASKIGRTVRAALADPAATEVVVVVDGCRDGTLEALEALRDEDGRVVPVLVAHGGKSAALTAGLPRATGEVTLLLDQDVVAGPGLVTGHARHHHDADDLVVVGYMPTVPDPEEGDVSVLTALYAEEYERHCELYEAEPATVLRRLWGGNVSIRTDRCRRVGLDFPYFGHEDQELGIRCLEAGLVGRFDRSLHAEHRHGRDAASFLWYSKMQGASRWQLHQDHPDALGPFGPDSVLDGMSSLPRAAAKLLTVLSLGDRSAAAAARLGDLAAGWPRGQALAYRFARRLALRAGATLAMQGREAELVARATARRRRAFGTKRAVRAPGLWTTAA
jgi:GT2 family glycosyltransferase